MGRSLSQTILAGLGLLVFCTVNSWSQQPAPAPAPAPSTPPAAAAHFDRLAAAKSIFIKNAGGDEIAFNVITRGFEGWGRYILVDSAEKADIVMEVFGPVDEKKKDDDSSKNSVHAGSQKSEPSTSQPPSEIIKAVVYDKNHRPMWFGTEEPKFAVRQKATQANLVQAAERLFARFHDKVEPPAKP
jgi:hypothetical protein